MLIFPAALHTFTLSSRLLSVVVESMTSCTIFALQHCCSESERLSDERYHTLSRKVLE